mgnify:FL=1
MSEIRANTISAANGTGPITLTKQSAAKGFILQRNNNDAFATLNSFNISATTDNANGDTTYTVTSAMSDANYLVFCTGGDDSTTDKHMMAQTQTGGSQQSTTTFRTFSRDISANSTGNIESHAQATFGDLA